MSARRIALVASLLAACLLVTATAHAEPSKDIVISQLYGGGGNSGATYTNDYIELLNRGDTAVDLGGWTVQYASAAGTTWQSTPLTGTLAPGHFYLVQEAQGAGGTAPLPAPDATGTIAMSAASGKVRVSDAGAVMHDLVGYGSATSFEGAGAAPGLSNTTADLRVHGGCTDTDDNAADFVAGSPTPRNSASAASDCSDAGGGGGSAPERAIHDIQGAGHVSPLAGQAVTTTGVVTAKRSNGLWLQDPQPDGDDATSEGIFVFTGSAPAVAVGDAVSLQASVQEFRAGGAGSTNLTTTELSAPTITVTSTGNQLPTATVIGAAGRVAPTEVIEDDAFGSFDFTHDGIDFYESLEGMRVQLDDAVVTGPTDDFGSNREIPVLPDAGAGAGLRTARGGIIIGPVDFNPERVILNDALSGPTLPSANVRDSFPGATVGVLDYSFGNFKLEVTDLPALADGGLEREVTTAAGTGELAAATFNVENLDPGDPQSKFDALAQVIVTNLRAPDLISVEEVQDDDGATNDGVVDAAQTWGRLIDAVAAAGGPRYSYREIDPVDRADGGEPGGNIRVGFLFRTDRGLAFVDRGAGDATTATSVLDGPHLSLSPGRVQPTDPAFNASRKPLAGEFTYDGHTLFAVANHWNSKGGDTPLFGRVQPPARPSETQRRQQAQVVHDFAQQILGKDARARVLVLGDFNDFDFSDALATLTAGGALHDLVAGLPQAERYSYVFEGNSQLLDHVVASDAVSEDLRSLDAVHVNSEFAQQTSDHDPLVARECEDQAPPALTVAADPAVLRKPNHRYVTVTVTVSAADTIDPAPQVGYVSATSSEPDDDPGESDGATTNDVVVDGPTTFRVRAERSETGPGRVYTFTYNATDACGNAVQRAATVTVPVR